MVMLVVFLLLLFVCCFPAYKRGPLWLTFPGAGICQFERGFSSTPQFLYSPGSASGLVTSGSIDKYNML